jgi:hypothetical protein
LAHKIRNIALTTAAVSALVFAPMLSMTASAAPADERVTIFDNGNYVDTNPGQEYDQTLAAVQGTGATVTPFDGGDGSAAAWTAALATTDVLVIPEMEVFDVYDPAGTSALHTDAAAVLKAWITAGHPVIVTGAYTGRALFDYVTGVDYSTVWSVNGSATGWVRQVTDPTLPATLPNGDFTGGSSHFNAWSAAQLAPLTPIYVSADGTNLGVGKFAAGTGSITYVAFDFFPDPTFIANGTNAAWAGALQTLVVDAAPAAAPTAPAAVTPTLASTGIDPTVPLAFAAILLAVGAVFLVSRRRTAAQA